MGEPDPAEDRPLPVGRLRSYKREQEFLVDKQWFGDEAGQDLIEAPSDSDGAEPAPYTVRSGENAEPPAESSSQIANTRHFNAIAPQNVSLGAEFFVVVQVATEAAVTGLGTAAGSSQIDFAGALTIDVYAPGLKAVGRTTEKLSVPAIGNSERRRFAFVAVRAGIQQVDVMAWNGSAQVAGVTLQIAVDAEPLSPNSNQASADMDMREPVDGEYTLDVAIEALPSGTERYRFQLRSDRRDVWEPMYTEPLLQNRLATFAATIGSINEQARNLHSMAQEEQQSWLTGLGTLLFDYLVPNDLKALLREQKDRIKVLNILSNSDPMPWELLFLPDPKTGDGSFLVNFATVARWRYGAAAGRKLTRSSNLLVLPSGAPPAAEAELRVLAALLQGTVRRIDNIADLNQALRAGGFDLLHFAAHNVHNAEKLAGAYVPFGKKRWDLAFMGNVPQGKFKSESPLVFMNACTSAGTVPLYTDLAGWAQRFLHSGSGAFIGCLWEVRDDSARIFSQVFYEAMTDTGATLGGAMRTARDALPRGDPTAFAYTLYGNPLAQFQS